MTPAARIEAAIQILDQVGRAGAPPDVIVDAHFRHRRYAGAKDRRAINDRVYNVLRRRARLDWWIERSGSRLEAGPRARVIADLALAEKAAPEEIGALFSGARHCPRSLDEEEAVLAQALSGRPLTHHTEMPDWVALEYPAWLDRPLRAVLGDTLAEEMMALNQPAPVDLRVNTIKATWEQARDSLADELVETQPTPLSPLGLRLPRPRRLSATQAVRDGWVEVQDEGSQLIALLTDARPGMWVADFCAGAGGHTLALAAAVAEHGTVRGRVVASDVSRRRIAQLDERMHRAGADRIQVQVLGSEKDPWVAEHAGRFDRVLLDVPCSGTGTWRRDPQRKWALGPIDLDEMIERQRSILANASRLVRPGGRLAYATCSLLVEEGEHQVASFLAGDPGFQALSMAEVWAQAVGGPEPPPGPFLRLSPATTGTDGFFCCVLERTGPA